MVVPDSKSFEIFVPERMYFHDGPLDFDLDHSRRKGHAYLFSDCIVIAEVPPKGPQLYCEAISTENLEVKDFTEGKYPTMIVTVKRC